MQRWYVASTHPRAETFAAGQLKNQDFETFVPLKEERRIIRHKPVHVSQPLFPSYLFVRFDRAAHHWRSINGTRGINRLICNGAGDMPIPLAVGVVEDIQRRANDGEFGPDTNSPVLMKIKPGQQVRVLNGPFADFEGLCTMSRSQRVQVLLNFLGRSSPITLRADQVCAA